jgi:hypothetical protein
LFLLLACIANDLKPLSVRVQLLLQLVAVSLALTWYKRDLIVIVCDSYLYLSWMWWPLLALLLLGLHQYEHVLNEVDGWWPVRHSPWSLPRPVCGHISELQWTVALDPLCVRRDPGVPGLELASGAHHDGRCRAAASSGCLSVCWGCIWRGIPPSTCGFCLMLMSDLSL